MRSNPLPWSLFAIFVVAGVVACTPSSGNSEAEPEAEEPELARYMSALQRWTHKTTLALQARNAELADFYLHEMEETIEEMRREAPVYEGHEVGTLTNTMLVPSVEALDAALDERAWSTVDERVQGLARSCNQCHETTGYGFVRVDLRDVPNPYAQDFASPNGQQ